MARLEVLAPSQIADPELRAMAEASGDGSLPFALKELVRLRIAALNECER